jgi:antitoxin (DNA-binding transcriptional repressor) of toxin-antitoxin stability system
MAAAVTTAVAGAGTVAVAGGVDRLRLHARTLMVIIMVMLKVNVAQAKAELSKYLASAAEGETVVICNRNVPVAELRAIPQAPRKPRPVGLAHGQFRVPSRFFDPLPDDLIAAFRGRP